jgi:CheY-like chemotaxis protein/HPt (histidine-containing phosphotransfer) domain-containing protein
LPLAPPEQELGIGGAQRILVAEDDPVGQRLALLTLEKLGYVVDVVDNGTKAVEAVRSGGYVAVLMDCQMPDLDGYEATAAIRRDEGAGPHMPVIAVTASVAESERERCLAAGMDDYVAKPFVFETLRATLARWVETGGDEATLDQDVVMRVRRLAEKVGETLVDQLSELFATDTPERVAALRQAVADGDPRALAEAAHTLKGSSASLGATTMVRLCEQLEALSETGGVAGADELITRLETLYPRVAKAVASIVR